MMTFLHQLLPRPCFHQKFISSVNLTVNVSTAFECMARACSASQSKGLNNSKNIACNMCCVMEARFYFSHQSRTAKLMKNHVC